MPRRNFRRRETQGKVPIQHSDTNILNTGGAAVPTKFVVLETSAGARTVTGATQTTKSQSGTDELCNIGDIVKYINLFAEAAQRFDASEDDDNRGWLEWAFMMVKENETEVPITQMGVQTLGDVCTKMYRNECIYTGMIPLGLNQPATLDIKIKVPRFKQKIRIGDEWRFVCYARDLKATSTNAVNVRLVRSFMYKSYS